MFLTFLKFELNHWFRSPLFYIFFSVVAMLSFAAVSNEDATIGYGTDNCNLNAPYVIQSMYVTLSMCCGLMVTAFVCAAAIRDFRFGTEQLMFTQPVDKLSYLMGRFCGSTLVAIVPMLGVSLGCIVASNMPWLDQQRVGETNWLAHCWSILLIVVPNTVIAAGIIFALSLWLRSTAAAFVAILAMIVGNLVSVNLIRDIASERIGSLLDPFGISTFSIVTRYWTIADKNTLVAANSELLITNRLVWIGVGLAALAVGCWRFSFTTSKSETSRKSRPDPDPKPSRGALVQGPMPQVENRFDWASRFNQWVSQLKIEVWGIVKSPVFLVISGFALINMLPTMLGDADESFGVSALPVTFRFVEIIRDKFELFLMVIIAFYAGSVVWRERESHLDEMHDAMPVSNWQMVLAKVTAMMVVVALLQLSAIALAILIQTSNGFTHFQLAVYFQELLLFDYVQAFCLVVLALFSHAISPNKYAGYALFILIAVVNANLWPVIGVESYLARFGQLPKYVYSDLYGLSPYLGSMIWFSIYWLLFSALMIIGAICFWQRGCDQGVHARCSKARERWQRGLRTVSALVAITWLSVGSWIFFNTHIINEATTTATIEQKQVDYEKSFAKYRNAPQPRVTDIKYDVDIFPERRSMKMRGVQTIRNMTDAPIEKLFVSMSDSFNSTVIVAAATIEDGYADREFQVFRFDPPLKPGDETTMSFTVSYDAKGFENEVSVLEIVENGTFFSSATLPKIGYQDWLQLDNKNKRRKHGLETLTLMNKLDPTNMAARSNTYASNYSDWVNVETTISTSADQIAIAPGSLRKRWKQDGRNYFQYKLDRPSVDFYSFISGRYKVAIRQWNGVDIEVYYHPDHYWNVDKMLYAVRQSLVYYNEAFGPYPHKQARIIEFPRNEDFAQAFPGTMPYSEGVGFVADLRSSETVDKVLYVVAHEIAHQWWVHQVVGANMDGATLLSETLAQYSALMVMEKELGKDMMRKFLKYEMDYYLRGRALESRQERPLATVSMNQNYIHYRKGAVVMYHLKEMIGEEKVNAALRTLLRKFGYKGPPYPTSMDLIDAIREQTPPEMASMIDDLFLKVILFANRTIEADYIQRDDGKYEVTLQIECKKYESGKDGMETEIPVNDWIEIGAFAETDSARMFGKTLYRERRRITDTLSTFKFVVNEKPALVGVDPFHLMVDKLPDNNTKSPSKK